MMISFRGSNSVGPAHPVNAPLTLSSVATFGIDVPRFIRLTTQEPQRGSNGQADVQLLSPTVCTQTASTHNSPFVTAI